MQFWACSIIQKLLALSGEEKEVHFYWHGGEPLLAGIDFYQKIILLENELNVYGKKICNHIQTNATLLTDNWVDFLVGNDFNVGISLDGPKEIQDVNRPTISGGGSFDSVMKGLKLFQEREKFPSIISVVTNESLGNANKIFDFFVENKIKRFLPKDCCERDETGKFLPFSTTPDEYVDFLIELFECWMSKNDPTIEIRNLYQIIRGVVGGKTTLCEYSGRCHLFLTIEYDGTIGGCDSFPVKNYPMGNINDSAVSSIFGSHGYKSFLRDMESTKTVTGEKVIGKEWRVISTEGICGGLQKEKEALSKEMYSKSSQFSAQLDLLTARPELEREKATQAIRDFMAKPDLQLQYIHTRRPSNFNVGIITNQTDNGYTSEDVDGWERKVEVYQQKEYIGNTCEVYEYEVDIRNNDIVQVGIRYPQEDIIENPKKQEECQDSHSLETSLLTLSEIEEIAMGYAQRGVKNFNEIKDKFIYEGSSVNPKAISAHNAWIYENKDYKLPEGLTAELPSKFPTIWSRVSSGGYLIMWLNTTGLFN